MPKEVKGRNGGKLRPLQKGDPAPAGAGRPKGSKSFKSLLEDALCRTTKGKDGQEVSLKEAGALQIVAMLLSPETDDNTKLRAFQMIRDTIGEAPIERKEVSGPDGGPIQQKTIIIELPPDPDGGH